MQGVLKCVRGCPSACLRNLPSCSNPDIFPRCATTTANLRPPDALEPVRWAREGRMLIREDRPLLIDSWRFPCGREGTGGSVAVLTEVTVSSRNVLLNDIISPVLLRPTTSIVRAYTRVSSPPPPAGPRVRPAPPPSTPVSV
ncbi:hypothetical protein NHX12_010130 [Muraenolepis orangiensis]|uniref:Uncharacterized protein n=1 Tax=Muraenolepis orangiensis TaxID=630683 RepID=A0A9Q0I8L3_9TELE|nr:hypothetical protein NHX12_010130 [Muraenolepis orangiensis]